VRPLVAESVVLPFSELVLDRALKASVAVDVLNSRRAVHGAHVAAERDTAAGRGTVAALFLLAVARSMSAVANSAVDGRGDGLHDLLALEEVVVLPVVQLVVSCKTGGGELVGELALVRVRALLRA